MGQTGFRIVYLSNSSMLSLFTAIIVFALFVVVSYTVITGPCCSGYQHPARDGLKELMLFKGRLVVDEESSISLSAIGQLKRRKMSEKRSTALKKADFMALIPNFKRDSRPSLLHRKITKSSSSFLHPVTHCIDSVCSEYLSTDDRSRYDSCIDQAVKGTNITLPTSKCKFMNGTGRDPVALVSLPGSGNTWVRGILESITGICTGAIYCDISLRSHGFTGEYVRGGSVLVVKTHENSPIWTDSRSIPKKHNYWGKFGSAMFILRNPFNALVAEWNRKVANNFTSRTTNLKSHTEAAGKEWFGNNELWENFVLQQARRWKTMLINWVINRKNHPVLVVKYESLQNDSTTELKRIHNFLGLNYDTVHTQNQNDALQTFHRKHNNQFDHYTPFQKSFVDSIVTETVQLLEGSNLSEVIDVKDYYANSTQCSTCN